MTGNYPDAPGARMAWDRDGTQAFYIDGANNVSKYAQGSMSAFNSESDNRVVEYNGTGNGYNRFLLMFPEKRDLLGYFVRWSSSYEYGALSLQLVEVSPDTTTGVDGAWTAVTLGGNTKGPAKPNYRTGIQALSGITNIKAVRFSWNLGQNSLWNVGWHIFHLYGKPTQATANQQKTIFWHPTLEQPLTDFPNYFDWGDRPRLTSLTKSVRIKNLSGTLTAHDVLVSVQSLTDAVPTMVSQYSLSYGGAPYASSVNLATLGPGEVSGPISIKQTLVDTAVLGLWSQRLAADPASWT